jgi:hypothetical protein
MSKYDGERRTPRTGLGGEWGVDGPLKDGTYEVLDLTLQEAVAVAKFLNQRRSAVDNDTTEQEAY